MEIENQNNSRKRLDSIEAVFEENFPKEYINNVAHWGNFSKEELHQTNIDGTQKLKHLDIDFGNSCSLRCPHCFRRDSKFTKGYDNLKEEEIKEYILQAKELGLESVKFLGAGEPFENPRFLGFLEWLKQNGISTSVFTKGHVIGDDNLAKKYNSQYGINNGKELAKKLKELDVSILLGFNSFDKETQENYVGLEKSTTKNYVEARDNALERLVEAGLNKYEEGKPTRLAMISAPAKPENVDELIDIYKWGRKRNIYALTCPSTVSGKGIDETERVKTHEGYIEKLKSHYVKVYKWNIENGLTNLEEFEREGVSLYPGCHPCTQTAAGMYLTLSGKVVRCPGRADKKSTFTEDIRQEENLKEVWKKSENYKRAEGKIKTIEGEMNYHCPARDWVRDNGTRALPLDFYQDIKNRVLNYFKSEAE
ncbi:MAG: radical SAM protein [Nanoarchaeota archaeon]|nr:radical SAM protein [Nanoarchaeota archaeon]